MMNCLIHRFRTLPPLGGKNEIVTVIDNRRDYGETRYITLAKEVFHYLKIKIIATEQFTKANNKTRSPEIKLTFLISNT